MSPGLARRRRRRGRWDRVAGRAVALAPTCTPESRYYVASHNGDVCSRPHPYLLTVYYAHLPVRRPRPAAVSNGSVYGTPLVPEWLEYIARWREV